MKPESIKSVLKSYITERQHSSSYNDIEDILPDPPECMPGFCDFFSGQSRHLPVAQGCSDPSRKSFLWRDGRADEVIEIQSAAPPLNVPSSTLEPQLEVLAAGLGHQLNQMVNEFEAHRIRQAPANGSRNIKFKERVICVSPSCDRVQIPVIRTSPTGGEVIVTWKTCDKRAKAGLHYVNGEGSISFAQDEVEKTIEIEIISGQNRRNDLHFAVELFDAEATFNTLMVYICDGSILYHDENQCIQNIFNCVRNISNAIMPELVICLSDKVTHNTFKAALLCVSSCADSMPTKELALGAELLRLIRPYGSLSSLTNVFCEFYSYLPELEDIVSMS